MPLATETELAGELCALGAALTWAVSLVLFKRSGERIPPLTLNMFKNVIGLVLLASTLLALPGSMEVFRRLPYQDVAVMVVSGLLGITLSDTAFFASLNLIGVGFISIVSCLYSPFIILFSYLILAEKLTLAAYLGTGMIVGAVLISSRHTPRADRTRRQFILGILLGALSMALVTLAIVIAKPVLDLYDFPLIPAVILRLLAGTFVLMLFVSASPTRKEHWSVFIPSADWKVSLPASVLGAYLAQIFWIAGFKYAKASIAGVLSQTTIIFAIILAAWMLKERFTRRKLAAVVLACAGVVTLTLLDRPNAAATPETADIVRHDARQHATTL
ncbi:MAG: DMT family transporter [Phycisphaerales bacterium]|nr:MAG: DMT family transporter [Phycisphaerales bacterium]